MMSRQKDKRTKRQKDKKGQKERTAEMRRTRRVRGGRVLEKCSEQGSERNQIRETIMVQLMGARNRYISNAIFTMKSAFGLIKLKQSVGELVS